MAIPGFPSNDYDWMGDEVGAALAGFVVRDVFGFPLAGVFPSRADLVKGRTDWFYDVAPFVAVRADERRVLVGPSVENETVQTLPAPTSNSRIDVIYSRPADIGAGEVPEAVGVVSGTASAVPVKPSLPSGAVELAQFTVSAGNANTAAAVGLQTLTATACAGGVPVFRTTAARNAFNATPGQLSMVGQSLFVRVGTTWKLISAPDSYRTELPVTNLLANATKTIKVTFPAGTFTATPMNAQATARSGSRGADATVNNLTQTGCDVHFHNVSSGPINMGAYLTVTQ